MRPISRPPFRVRAKSTFFRLCLLPTCPPSPLLSLCSKCQLFSLSISHFSHFFVCICSGSVLCPNPESTMLTLLPLISFSSVSRATDHALLCFALTLSPLSSSSLFSFSFIFSIFFCDSYNNRPFYCLLVFTCVGASRVFSGLDIDLFWGFD